MQRLSGPVVASDPGCEVAEPVAQVIQEQTDHVEGQGDRLAYAKAKRRGLRIESATAVRVYRVF